MTTRKIRQAEAEVAEAELALKKAKLKLTRAEAEDALPTEPTRIGTTLRFKVQFRRGEQTYTYIAFRVAQGWTLTGERNRGKVLTWEQVIAIADRNYNGRPHFEDLGV